MCNSNLRAMAMLCTSLIAACSTMDTTQSVEDALTPGIFLDLEGRAALPPGVELRNVYAKGLDVTKASEGFRNRMYNDAAKYCTIAYGHLIKRAPCSGDEPGEFRQGMSEPKGAELLVKDMEKARLAVMTLVKVEMTDGQYAALCDFVFNAGGGNLKTSKLLQAINANQFDRVPAQFRRWTLAGGKEWPGLKTRREREIDLFFDGLPKPKAAPPEGEDLSPIDIRIGEK
ncbi:MAG: lysozyme [Betaproteobacteria bacterium]